MTWNNTFAVLALAIIVACNQPDSQKHAAAETKSSPTSGTFGYDLSLLQEKHPDAVVLYGADTAQQIVVVPAYQGRIMTSTMTGRDGLSFGWINHAVIKEGNRSPI